ncbi:MAG: hypothetical protein KGJ55_05065 [Gammaproteobacteria bacterium]|nr:hypothetical protein [Gammaproteobacteria bacterium]
MPYPDPSHVLTPRSRIRNVQVLYDGGEGEWSLAQLEWDNTTTLGIRWNGDADTPIGNPQSCGHPTCCILPEALASTIKAAVKKRESPLLAAYREMAQDEKPEEDARAWADALIGDAAGAADETW